MPDDLQQRAPGGRGDLFGQLVPFFFEVAELDLDQFMQGQFLLNAGEKSLAHPVVAHFENGFEQLSLAFEAAAVGGCQCWLQAPENASACEELKNGKGRISEQGLYEAYFDLITLGNLYTGFGRVFPDGTSGANKSEPGTAQPFSGASSKHGDRPRPHPF